MKNKDIVQNYRLIINKNPTYKKYIPVFEAVEKMIDNNKSLIIAIEGRCGSGKSSLTTLMAKIFDCNVFHMDDFFLPLEMKTKKRLAEPGGNVHYERFKREILESLQKYEPVTYGQYNCKEGTLGEPIHVEFKKITIVEGVYSMHPTLQQVYDYSVFLTVQPQVQIKRIRKRNGEEMLQNFINKWIPMEENYFSQLNVQEHCNIVIDTSVL